MILLQDITNVSYIQYLAYIFYLEKMEKDNDTIPLYMLRVNARTAV